MNTIAIFISGEGSNATRMLREFQNSPDLRVQLVYSSKPNSGVEELCEKLGVSFVHLPWDEGSKLHLLELCQKNGVQWIVLAGFLKLIPNAFLATYSKKIINIHPSLLPKFGGKGMYGMHVHKAVVESGEQNSGITIHYVDGAYDQGQIIQQFSVAVLKEDTPELLFDKVRLLEKSHFTKTVAEVILNQ